MLSKIQAFSPAVKKVASKVSSTINNSKVVNKVGGAISDSKFADKFFPHIDAIGANNTFEVLVGLMTLVVIFPRVRTAYKRNPNDKEATKDEITEILFRDITTCTTILLALKILNTIIAGGAGKLTGLPMTNKSREQVFNSVSKGFQGIKDKAKEFCSAPLQKLKTEAKNIIDVINPKAGKIAYKDAQFASKYSKMDNFFKIQNMLKGIDAQGGSSDKILKENVIPDLIKTVKAELEHAQTAKLLNTGNDGAIAKLQETIDKLEGMLKQDKLIQCFENDGEKLDDSLKPLFINYFTKSDNSLVKNGGRLNGGLRTVALAIESSFLGFGLPTLNQMRLEKKYLSEKKTKEPIQLSQIYNINEKGETTLGGSKLKEEEVKLFEQFVK